MNGEAEVVVEGGTPDRKAEEIAHRVLDQILLTLPANLVIIGTETDRAAMEIAADLSMMKP